jgi:geranylgeranyl diphosphate synthase type II
MGAIVADAQEKETKRIIDFAAPMGIAYQLQDDILNVSQKKEIYGKEFAGDIYEGKRTLMIIRLIRLCTAKERKRIVALLNRPRERKTSSDIDYILGLIEKYDCLAYAKSALLKLSAQSKEALDNLSLYNNQGRRELEQILRFATERDR